MSDTIVNDESSLENDEKTKQDAMLAVESKDEVPLEPSKENEPTLEPSKEKEPTLEPSKEKEPTLEPSKEKEPTLEPSKENEPTLESSKEKKATLEPGEESKTPTDASSSKGETPSNASPSKEEIPTNASPSKGETNKALQHLVQGKRHLLVRDIHSAVESLQEACKLFGEQYGETADQCGEAYFVYGKALLELARLETGVLGNVGTTESSDDEEEEEKDEDDSSPREKNDDNSAADTESNGAVDKENGIPDGLEPVSEKSNGKENESLQDCDTEESKENQGQNDEDEDEAVTNIQLAWEVLELAKVIFERQAKGKESDLKLSQVYLKLGEVSIESENYTQAVSDLDNCLQIQKKHLGGDDRLIAETYYHQGIANSLMNEFSNAIHCFGNAVETMQSRITNLNVQISKRVAGSVDNTKEPTDNGNPFYKEEDEIKELKDLLPDIEEKITDMKQMEMEVKLKLAEMFSKGIMPSSVPSAPISPVKSIMKPEACSSSSTTNGSENPPKEARSISHLVKRKRPADEELNGNAKKQLHLE